MEEYPNLNFSFQLESRGDKKIQEKQNNMEENKSPHKYDKGRIK